MKKNIKYMIFLLSIFGIGVLVDLLTKIYLNGRTFSIIEGVISFKSAHNFGAAWSLFAGNTLLLILLPIIFLIMLSVIFKFFKNKNCLVFVSYGFIFAGAVGNLLDRIFLGYVRDFIKLEFVAFPIFNMADIFINVGVGLLIIFLIFFEGRSKKEIK